MGQITGIDVQKNKQRVSIFVDGEFFIGLDAVTAAEHRLTVGASINEDELNAIAIESDKASAFNKALAVLSSSMKSEYAIHMLLLEKGYCNEAVIDAIVKLKNYGYIDDIEYVRSYMRMREDKEGRNKIKYELIGKGVAPDLVEEVFASTVGSDEETCLMNAEKFMFNKERSIKSREKLARFLYSKGYKTQDVYKTVKLIMGRTDEE